MRKGRRLLAMVVVLAMLAVSAVPAFAGTDKPQTENADLLVQQDQQLQGEYLVQYKEDIAKKTNVVEQELGDYDAEVVKAVTPDIQLVTVDRSMTEKEETEFIKEAEALDEVEYVEPNVTVKVMADASTAEYPQWGLEKIQAREAWSQLPTGTGTATVAVIDTGVDATHPDLQDRVLPGKTFVKRNSKGNRYDTGKADDDFGHGTHVAGIVAANCDNSLGIDGVSGKSNVRILPIKSLDDKGDGTLADIIQGVKYAADQGADVINLSLGFYTYSVFLEEAVQYAQSKGCVLVAAAGNEAEEFEKYKEPSEIAYPAAYDGVLAVGASKKDNSRASFSNYGDGLDLMAPGLFIMSTLPKSVALTANEEDLGEIYNGSQSGYYLKMSGTSSAAPHVAAVAALYKLKDPSASSAAIMNHLRNTAQDLGKAGYDTSTGYGLVNANKALTQTAAAAPGRSSVTLQGLGIRSIKVSWSTVKDATGYEVYRAAGTFGEYKKVKTVSAGNSCSFTDSNLDTDTNYCYKVIAYKNVNGKKISGVASEPKFCATSALEVSLKGKAKGYKGVQLSWNKSKKAKGYVVYRATKRKGTYKKIATVKKGTYLDKKTVVGKNYYYRVKAYLKENGKTVYSDASNTVKRKAVLKKPAVALKKQGGSRIQASWNKVDGAQGYQVFVSNKKRGEYKKVKTLKGSKKTAYTSGRLKSGKTYYYKVRAYRVTSGKKGYSSFSSPKSERL